MKRTHAVGDRRQGNRQERRGPIQVTLETRELAGETENVSPSGVLFLSGDAVKVTVEFNEGGTLTRRSGRLVRGQRMDGRTMGWAVEFDDPIAG